MSERIVYIKLDGDSTGLNRLVVTSRLQIGHRQSSVDRDRKGIKVTSPLHFTDRLLRPSEMSQNDPVPLMAYRRIGIQVGCSPALLLRAAGVPFVEEAKRGVRLVHFPKRFVERKSRYGGCIACLI